MVDRKRSEEGGELGSGEWGGYSRGGEGKQEGCEVRVLGISELSAGGEWLGGDIEEIKNKYEHGSTQFSKMFRLNL